MSLYAIGVGGTGAKCLEAIAILASVGLLSDPGETAPKITLLFVDADETNGSLERSRNSISLYQRSYRYFSQYRPELPWMQTNLKDMGLWSPFSRTSTDKKLGSLLHYNTLKQTSPVLGGLFDVLYTAEEREASLDVGFRGRPAIGSAVMSQVDLDRLDEPEWRQLIESINADAGSGGHPKIMLFGSMFGGTGASGLPTLGRLLAEKLSRTKVGGRVPVGCSFLLPYFSFTPSGEVGDGEVFARADQFLLSTEAALRYYLTQAEQMFNTVYLLGNQSLSSVKFSIGKQTQRNQPHFMELFAALAARHFLLRPEDEASALALISRQNQGQVTWSDIPDQQVIKSHLGCGVRFAYTWLANIAPELKQAVDMGVPQFSKEAPWFSRFYKTPEGLLSKIGFGSDKSFPDFNAPDQQQAIEAITEWCKDFLRWITAIHQCEAETVKLFEHTREFSQLSGQRIAVDRLATLVAGISVDRNQQNQDTIPNLKLNLNRDWSQANLGDGTTGLARAVYRLCQIST